MNIPATGAGVGASVGAGVGPADTREVTGRSNASTHLQLWAECAKTTAHV